MYGVSCRWFRLGTGIAEFNRVGRQAVGCRSQLREVTVNHLTLVEQLDEVVSTAKRAIAPRQIAFQSFFGSLLPVEGGHVQEWWLPSRGALSHHKVAPALG